VVLQGEAVKIFFAFVSSGSRAIWPNRESCRARIVAESCRRSVVHLTSDPTVEILLVLCIEIIGLIDIGVLTVYTAYLSSLFKLPGC